MRKIELAGGRASNTGFKITTRNGKTVRSRGYDENEGETNPSGKHIIAIGAIWIFYDFILLFLLFRLGLFAQNFLVVIILSLFILFVTFIPALMMVVLLSKSNISGKKFLEYHACEHKVAALLEKGCQPNIENLKKMPRVHPECGTSILSLVGTAPLAVSIFITLLMYVPWLEWVAAILFTVCFILLSSHCLQYFFATSEPSEEKLKEALEVAKEFYK